MRYRSLGTTGLMLSELSLGTMNFGEWANRDTHDADAIVGRAIDAGINLIDTADVYSGGESERILGRSLQGRTDRDQLIIATKFHNPMGTGPNDRGNSRHWIMRALEASLSRLRLDHIDLYQIHRPDPATATEETLGALNDLVHQGKIRYYGVSTFAGHELTDALWTAERHGLVRPVSEQAPYSILAREVERDVLPVTAKHSLGVIAWSPLAGGWLGRGSNPGSRLERQPERHSTEFEENRIKREAVRALAEIADELGTTLPVLAVAFVLANRTVTSVLLGPRIPAHLDELLAAAELELSDEVLERIDTVVAPGRTINPADTGYRRDHVAGLVRHQRTAPRGL